MVLLPEGKIINNPDTVKLIKVLPTTLNDQTFFVVVLKLDDDSELMLDRCTTRMEAEALADRCRRLLNGEESDSAEIPSFIEEDSEQQSAQVLEEESSDWDMSSDEEPVKPPTAEEESSSWDFSSEGVETIKSPAPAAEEESSSWEFSSEGVKTTTKTAEPPEEESSSWEFSSDEKPTKSASTAEEESSSWGFSSEEVDSKPPKKSSKPKIQQPYTESEEPPPSTSGKKAKKSSKTAVKSKPSTPKRTDTEPVESKQDKTVQPKSVPRVTGFIEDDSDEWIPDNGLDDWHD